MCIESITAPSKSNVNEKQMDRNKNNLSAQEPVMDATANDGLRIRRVAGGYMVQYPPLFSRDGNLLFIIYEKSIQAFSATTGEFVRSYESKTGDGNLIGMVLDSSQEKYIFGCTVDGLLLAWKIDSGLLSHRLEIVKVKFVAESFHVLYDQNGISSFLLFGTSTKKLFFQYCPHKQMILQVVRPAIHPDKVNEVERKAAAPVKHNNVPSDVRIVAAPGGYGLNYFAYIAKSRWYWVQLKPGLRVDSMPHCGRIEPVVLACHPTNAILAVGDALGRIVLYRNFLTKEKICFETYHWHSNPVTCLAFSSNGTHFYSGGQERVLVKWSIGQEEKVDWIPRLTDSIVHVVVGPENVKMVLCTADNGIHVMNALHKQTATVQSFSKISGDVSGELFPAGLRVNPRTHTIIMNGRVGCIQFFSTHTKSMLYTLDITLRNYIMNEDNKVIYNTVVTNIGVNAHWLATVENWNDHHNSKETRLKFWKYNESRQIYALNTNLENVHQGGVFDIAFSSSSRERDLLCATAGQDRRIKVWSLEEIETTDGGEKVVWVCVGSVQHRNLPVRSISFSQDASLLAGGFGNVMCIWNADTLKLKCALSAASGYDGCVNRAIIVLPHSATNAQIVKKQSLYDDARSKILSEMMALINGKGKSSLCDNANETRAQQQRSRQMFLARRELIESVSESHKKYIVQQVQTNSKMSMMQRAELFHSFGIRCRTNEKIQRRIRSKLLASSRSARGIDQCLHKICGNISNIRQFRIIRKQQNYVRRRLPPAPFENGLKNVFSQRNIYQKKIDKKDKTLEIGHRKEIANPIKSFAQIHNVLFCYGQFSHLVVITTENRMVVWNLLTLKMQVSAALTINRITLDPITNLIAAFTKDNELYVFLPNIPMPLYHRINMPKVLGAVWVPRRYPSTQSFNVDWQAISQLFFLNEKQELQQLVSDNDEELLGPVDSDDDEDLVAGENVNEMSVGFKTPFAAMLTKQAIGSKAHRSAELRSGISIGLGNKSAVSEIVASSSHTMAPVNLLCTDFLKSLLVTEENRTKESKSQDQIPPHTVSTTTVAVAEADIDSLYDANDTVNGYGNADKLGVKDKTIKLSNKLKADKPATITVNQLKQNQTDATATPAGIQFGKLSDEFIDIVF